MHKILLNHTTISSLSSVHTLAVTASESDLWLNSIKNPLCPKLNVLLEESLHESSQHLKMMSSWCQCCRQSCFPCKTTCGCQHVHTNLPCWWCLSLQHSPGGTTQPCWCRCLIHGCAARWVQHEMHLYSTTLCSLYIKCISDLSNKDWK